MHPVLRFCKLRYIERGTVIPFLANYTNLDDFLSRLVKKGELLRLKNGFYLIADLLEGQSVLVFLCKWKMKAETLGITIMSFMIVPPVVSGLIIPTACKVTNMIKELLAIKVIVRNNIDNLSLSKTQMPEPSAPSAQDCRSFYEPGAQDVASV